MGVRPRRRQRAAPKLKFRRWLRRQDRFTRGLLFGVIALATLVIGLIVPRLNEKHDTRKATRGASTEKNVSRPQAPQTVVARVPTPRSPQKTTPLQPTPAAKKTRAAAQPARAIAGGSDGPRAAIVIDDLGQSISHFEQLAALNIPLSIAVIPGLPASERTVSEAARRGIELLLHQPMEPREESGKNPGEGVLLTSMSTAALRARVRANLAAVPGAVGVNNHMGSRFTTDEAGLSALMAEIKEHGLFWLDSRTIAGTRGVEVARAAGVPALSRDIFLDAEVSADAIRRQVRKLLESARTHGAAIGIGHPHPETIAALRELRPELLASGVTLVPVSNLLHARPPKDSGTALTAAVSGKNGPGEIATIRKAPTP